MSYHIYLVDKEEKLLVDCGSVTRETFENDFEYFEDVRNFLYENNESFFDFDEIQVKNLTLSQFSRIIKRIEVVSKLESIVSRWIALAYKYENIDKNLEIIGEEKAARFKSYKRI